MKKLIFIFIYIFSFNVGFAQNFEIKSLKKDLKTLASDKFMGRGTGTKGEILAREYIIKRFKKIGLEPKGENGTFVQIYPAKKGMPGNFVTVNTQNILGFIDNKRENTIFIGAHYDHLGMGDQGSSLAANSSGQIHNGADDNASGVAGLLAMATYFNNNKVIENYNFIFGAFSGEELGLFGSKFLLDNPTFSTKDLNCMINLDMIGHYRSEKGLAIGGIGTSDFWEKNAAPLATRLNIKYTLDSSGVGPSDHTSFYLKDIPVLFLFTGAHEAYHKPTDDVELINFEGEVLVLNYLKEILDLLNESPRINFKKAVSNPHAGNVKSSFKVTMGVIPDYAYDKGGLRLDGVSDGKPGFKAGLKTGDIIKKIGDYPIKDVYGYMDALSKFSKGQSTKIEVLRKEETLILDLEF